jgi:hypothetical protein
MDSLDNLSSIPLLKNIRPNPLIANFDAFIKHVPFKVVFSFDADSVENIKTHLDDRNTTVTELVVEAMRKYRKALEK